MYKRRELIADILRIVAAIICLWLLLSNMTPQLGIAVTLIWITSIGEKVYWRNRVRELEYENEQKLIRLATLYTRNRQIPVYLENRRHDANVS